MSFIATLGLLGAALSSVHLVSIALGLHDLIALMLFALPLIAYIAYCTAPTRAQVLRATIRIYSGFAATLLASAALVYFIG